VTIPDADPIFFDPRLAAVYDQLDPDRSDLDEYLAVGRELGAGSVLDVGCGTGTFACLLVNHGFEVVGVDPAGASLDVARTKPGADQVRWIDGDATRLPGDVAVDVATMTANVAQVFVTDEAWEAALRGIHAALVPGGHLVFETRNPARRAWEVWNRVDSFVDVDEPAGLVTFQSYTRFVDDDVTIPSTSTLRFRSREEVTASLARCGFVVRDVRDPAYVPDRAWLFLAEAG
jgi:SAM-dependent methyltransferase